MMPSMPCYGLRAIKNKANKRSCLMIGEQGTVLSYLTAPGLRHLLLEPLAGKLAKAAKIKKLLRK